MRLEIGKILTKFFFPDRAKTVSNKFPKDTSGDSVYYYQLSKINRILCNDEAANQNIDKALSFSDTYVGL